MSFKGKPLGKRVFCEQCNHFVLEENVAGGMNSKFFSSAMAPFTFLC